jgi:uncharacterized RDD family membrane protein YckC
MLEFTDRRPLYCSHCGLALASAKVHEATTLPFTPTSDPSDESVDQPTEVGRYRIIRQLGRGGMGVVLEAEDTQNGRRVALKLLSPGLAGSAEAMERFMREARLAAGLSHPRTTFVYEAGEDADRPYIAMELMPGCTLQHVCEESGHLAVNRAVDYILDVIDGLRAAHAAGVVHRDVKPSNCFVESTGRVKIGDFGLAKSLVADTALTQTGAFLGTPLFAAPEQVKGGRISPQTDVYAVGATLFYLITGRGPFVGDGAAVIAQIASDRAPSLRSLCPTVPADLDTVLARTLEKNPQRRHGSLTELRRALAPFASSGTVCAPLGQRLGAYFIDMFLIGLLGGCLTGAGFAFMFALYGATLSQSLGESSADQDMGKTIIATIVAGQLAFFVATVLYFALMEWRLGYSLGKRWLGLRVVGEGCGRTGIGQATLRAAMVPGLLWLGMAMLLPFLYPSSTVADFARYDPDRILKQQLLTPLAFVPLLVCLTSMRAQNGYRGWHEILSGTRVVAMRSAPSATRWDDVPLLVPRAETTIAGSFGPFSTTGVLGYMGESIIYLAHDETLKRAVWIKVRPGAVATSSSECSAANGATGPRWLQGGDRAGQRWDAFEALPGAPLDDAVRAAGGLDWGCSRVVLYELADRLLASARKGILPPVLSLSQVWVEPEGRVNLLEAPIRSRQTGSDPASEPVSFASPTDLLRAAANACSAGPTIPAYDQEFLRDLERRPNGDDTLAWAIDSLRAMRERPATITWNDRLVSIGVAMGAEYVAYQAALGLLVVALRVGRLPDLSMSLVAVLSALILPAFVGFCSRGGPAFALMGIAVRRRDGGPASRWRCAWRTLVAWSLIMVYAGLNFTVAPMLLRLSDGSIGVPPTQVDAGDSMRALFVLFPLASLLLLFQALGAIYAVLWPTRGIQDLLASTRLLPR